MQKTFVSLALFLSSIGLSKNYDQIVSIMESTSQVESAQMVFKEKTSRLGCKPYKTLDTSLSSSGSSSILSFSTQDPSTFWCQYQAQKLEIKVTPYDDQSKLKELVIQFNTPEGVAYEELEWVNGFKKILISPQDERVLFKIKDSIETNGNNFILYLNTWPESNSEI